jgi:phage portal protein BeeE
MSTALTKSLDAGRAFALTVQESALRLKAEGTLGSIITPNTSGTGFLSDYKTDAKNRESYGSFRNWLYSAVNALAMEGAEQPINLAKLSGVAPVENKRRRPGGGKSFIINKMPRSMRTKAAVQEYEMILDHPAVKLFEQPNEMQGRWQFIYSFFANLNLTGWSYVVFDKGENGEGRMYSVPTTWVRPDHKDGAFSKFYVVNPQDPAGIQGKEPLTRDNVAFAYLPDPSNPLSAIAPATSQLPAIRIDDYIQASQQQYFQNGIFPSVIVTMGKNPLGDVPGGVRPTLTGAQRRQIITAINKAMAGVANFGAPAIVDGLIESITKLSMTGTEMGWERSEEKVRTRILSAFGVHPFILGEPLGVGGYSQSTNILSRFYRRVNSGLDMLSTMLTKIACIIYEDDTLVAWAEECVAVDPSLRQSAFLSARANGDITQNELRAELGMPPDEDTNESLLNGTSGGLAVAVLSSLGQGLMQRDQAVATLTALGLPDDKAEEMAGRPSEETVVQNAVDGLGAAVAELQKPVDLGEDETLLAEESSKYFFSKFNPNHDESGRFDEGSGGAGSSGGPSTNESSDTSVKDESSFVAVTKYSDVSNLGLGRGNDVAKGYVHYYQTASKDVNKALRSGKANIAADNLDKAFTVAKELDKDLVLYRGMSNKAADKLVSAGVGAVVQDKAFMSTSISPKVADFFAGRDEDPTSGWQVKLGVSKGTKAIAVGHVTKRGKEEKEVLLNRKTSFKVMRIDKETQTIYGQVL